ncbi:MAG: macro domain-containing protein [Clostridia bacterium]|nr:macro domain-containing protein [Clostridia bacterium]
MPYSIVRNDITKMRVDAIVNPTDWMYSGGGGTDEKVHLAAGKALDRECEALPPLRDGMAVVTGAYKLPCRYIIHTVGPVWEGGNHHERETLIACYRNALYAAADRNCERYGCICGVDALREVP